MMCLRLGQLRQEVHRVWRPPAAHFRHQHHQNVFCRAFLRAQGSGAPSSSWLPPRSRHQRRHTEDEALHFGPTQTPKWCPQPIGRRGTGATHQPAPQHGVHPNGWARRCPCPDPDVHPSPSLATNMSSRRLHREPAPTQNHHHSTCCAVVAARIETATPASTAEGRGSHKRRRRRTRNEHGTPASRNWTGASLGNT